MFIVYSTRLFYPQVQLADDMSADDNVYLESCYLTDMSNGNAEPHYLIQSGSVLLPNLLSYSFHDFDRYDFDRYEESDLCCLAWCIF